MSEYDLYQGGCLHKLPLLSDKSIDLVLTDPPYNIAEFASKRGRGLKGLRNNRLVDAQWDKLSDDSFAQLMGSMFALLAPKMRVGGGMIIFTSTQGAETIRMAAEHAGFYYKTTGVWHKTNPIPANYNLHFVSSIELWQYYTYHARTGVFNNPEHHAVHNFVEAALPSPAERRFGKHPT